MNLNNAITAIWQKIEVPLLSNLSYQLFVEQFGAESSLIRAAFKDGHGDV